jgi:DNA replication protein DnaC
MSVEYCEKCHYPLIKCQCSEITERAGKEHIAALQRETAALGGALAARMFTLENYANKKAIADCEGYPQQGLFLYGPTGCGKTHLATALVRKQPFGRVFKPTDILRQMRGCESAREEDALIKGLATGPLVIDDLGVEKITEFAATTLYEIFDRRWMADCGGLIVTSNCGLNGLAAKIGDDRIISRIAGMCKVVKIEGRDGRLK